MKRLWLCVAIWLVVAACVVAPAPLSGELESTIELAPSALIFRDFITDITTELVVDYTIYGWQFGSKSTFGLAGWSEQEYTVFGRLGAFTLDATLTFDPLIVDTVVYTLAKGVTYQTQSVTGVTSAGTLATWTKSIWNCAMYDEKVTY